MGRKSLGKGLGALITNDNPINDKKDSVLEESIRDKTKLESIETATEGVAWDTPEETQRLEVYEKALNKAWVDGAISPDEKGIIEEMREYLRITEREHREIESKIIAQQEVMRNIEAIAPKGNEVSEMEQINCPKCKFEIEIEYSEKDKIHLKCPECGAKGRLPNPYLKKIEEKAKSETEKEVEKGQIKDEKKKKVDEKKPKKDKPGTNQVEDETDHDLEKVLKDDDPAEDISSDSEPVTDEDEDLEIWDRVDIEEKLKSVKVKLEKRLNGESVLPEPGSDRVPLSPEPSLPFGIRLSDDTPEIMTFTCPHCTSPFNTRTSEDPQKIPCPTCSKNVTIIKPITFQCPECENSFPSIVQGDSKIISCPYCAVEIELRK